jgi:hypothetical protein
MHLEIARWRRRQIREQEALACASRKLIGKTMSKEMFTTVEELK